MTQPSQRCQAGPKAGVDKYVGTVCGERGGGARKQVSFESGERGQGFSGGLRGLGRSL